jgi:hypothetical protein
MVLEILMVVFAIVLYMVLFELWVRHIVKLPVDEDLEVLMKRLLYEVDISDSEE